MEMQKIEKVQVNARIEWQNWSTFLQLAAEAGLPGQAHKFASVLLNLIAECVMAEKSDWDSFKTQLPGFRKALAARRKASVSGVLDSDDRLDAIRPKLNPDNTRRLERVAREILDEQESQTSGKASPRPKAS